MLNTDNKLINPELRIENTNDCNAHCVMCPREKMTRPIMTMSNGKFKKIIDQADDLGVKCVSIFGYGEPLMDPYVIAKTKMSSDKNLETFITTNGSLLDLRMSHGFLDAGLKNIRFSFHALALDNFSKVHRGLDFLKVMRNFGNFTSINKAYNYGCKVHISTIPMMGESVEQIRDVWEKDCDYLEVWKPHNWVSGRKYRERNPKKKTCGRPFSGPVQIQADGDVIPCCFMTNAELVMGNVFKESIYDILVNDNYKDLRASHTSGNLENLPCEKCDQLNEEEDSSLLYSNRDKTRSIGKTSTCKISVQT